MAFNWYIWVIILDPIQASNEGTGVRRSVFSCITKFGIRMTAEDCNLEILRLSYTNPPTPTTRIPFRQNYLNIGTTTMPYKKKIDREQYIGLPTPVDLSLSTPLRFKTQQKDASLEPAVDNAEEGVPSENGSLDKMLHLVDDYLSQDNNSPGNDNNGHFPIPERVKWAANETLNDTR